jgi:hypothetical protein
MGYKIGTWKMNLTAAQTAIPEKGLNSSWIWLGSDLLSV